MAQRLLGGRERYSRFEGGVTNPSADIYRYEMPGGQYTNLKAQVESLGLGHRFDAVKEMYRDVNEMLGDIVKVTPSSKMVGDLAIFMVQNDLTLWLCNRFEITDAFRRFVLRKEKVSAKIAVSRSKVISKIRMPAR